MNIYVNICVFKYEWLNKMDVCEVNMYIRVHVYVFTLGYIYMIYKSKYIYMHFLGTLMSRLGENIVA